MRNLNPIEPTDEEIRALAGKIWLDQRGGGDGFDAEDWLQAKNALFMDKNYDAISRHFLAEPDKSKKEYFGEVENRKCRFCGNGETGEQSVTFEMKAHALPEFIGNKNLLSNDECDDCNSFFSKTIENEFASWLRTGLVLTQTLSKKSSKSQELEDVRLLARRDSLTITDHIWSDSVDVTTKGRIEVDESKNLKKYVPLLLFKCLVKMGVSILPKEELSNFHTTARWVRSPDLTHEPFGEQNFGTVLTFIPGPLSNYTGAAFLFRRKVLGTALPHIVFLLTFKNFAFQVSLPMAGQEADGMMGFHNTPSQPTCNKFYEKFGAPIYLPVSLSSVEKTPMGFDFGGSGNGITHAWAKRE